MGQRTPTDETDGLDRRALTLGLGASGLGLGFAVAGPASALTAQDVPPAPEDPTPRLLTNLLTRMGARVTINGRSGYVFVLDTGAGRTAIADDVAALLDLPPGPNVRVHGVTSAELASTARIDRITFANRRFTRLETPLFPRSQLAADGLLGLDVLSQFRMRFDLHRRRVSLTPSGPEVVAHSITFATPTRLSREARTARRGLFGQLILLTCKVDGVAVDAFIDSGAQYSIGNMALRRALRLDQAAREQPVQVYGVTGQTLMAESGVARGLEIDNRRLGPTPLLFADLHAFDALGLTEQPALLLGADVLIRFTEITLDFPRSSVRFGRARRD